MRIILISICIGAIAIFALPYVLISRTKLPQPSGKWQVGTTDITWDAPDRSQTGIIAKVWYPTNDRSGKNSPYIGELGNDFTDSFVLNIIYKLIFRLLRHVSSPALINAAPSQISDNFPVVLFSPCWTGINYMGTFYALEFASHGFVVVGINHPESNIGTMCADGSQIKLELFDMSMDAIKLEQYQGNIIQQQARNISTVLDRIIQLNSTPDSLLNCMINPSNVFAVGHSLGGAASFVACGKDARIEKGVELDSIFIDLDHENANYIDKELLVIYADRDRYKLAEKNKNNRRLYDANFAIDKKWMDILAAKTEVRKLTIDQTTHSSLTDLGILINPVIGQKIGLLGQADGLSILSKTSKIMIDFFNGIN
jgi:predicted dienelactone hydrolase